MVSIGWSKFATNECQQGSGNSYTAHTPDGLCEIIKECWEMRIPGSGEVGIDRKVLVPVPVNFKDQSPAFFCPARMDLAKGLPVQARVKTRQEGEDPFVEVFVEYEDAVKFGFSETPASHCEIVCYSAEALEENDGERTTDCDWEIVTILARTGEESEPMYPLAMARNFLEMPGGTKSIYTAKEFAEAIYFHAGRGIKVLDTQDREHRARANELDALNREFKELKNSSDNPLRGLGRLKQVSPKSPYTEAEQNLNKMLAKYDCELVYKDEFNQVFYVHKTVSGVEGVFFVRDNGRIELLEYLEGTIGPFAKFEEVEALKVYSLDELEELFKNACY